jgi:ribonucleoside-triphosphate reductase
MGALKMNPSRDAGRFAYHLKFLLKADLIEAVVETKKYCLTELGKMVIDVADRIDKKAFTPKSMLVRESRSAIEEFDANRIASSLVKEARMPAELAQKVAKEAEKQLLRSKTKYLTAPLVREVVNAILIEKGLEEYRNKLTRLGVPVHDVTSLIEQKNTTQRVQSIHQATGETVLKEYTLLNVFPRDIADAHLSGSLHINGLSSWILKPTEIVHDARFFLQHGLSAEEINPLQRSIPPPRDLETALSVIFNAMLHSSREVDTTQTFEYFNIFLAPYAKSAEPSKVKEALHMFVADLAQHADTSLSLELTVPDHTSGKTAFGQSGNAVGKYGDFKEESHVLASLLLDTFAEQSVQKPLLNPKLIVNIRAETFRDERARALLLKAHRLASDSGTPYFANLLGKNHGQSVFCSSGAKLNADLSGDWEIDTLRTGCLGVVTVNVPRAVHECGKDQLKFNEILKERLEMASRALEIKYRALRQHGKGLLPFVLQSSNGDLYLRLENCLRIVNLAGLKEAAEAFCAKDIGNEKTLDFIQDTVQNISAFVHKIGRRRGKRLYAAVLPSLEASERLAQLDVERYGVARTRFSGTRDKPFYSTVDRLTFQHLKTPQELVAKKSGLGEVHAGRDLSVIELGEGECRPDELVAVTRQLVEDGVVELFTYNRRLTYCANCKKIWPGLLHKCLSCGAVGTLVFFDRFAGV